MMGEIRLDRSEELGAILGSIVDRLQRLESWIERTQVGVKLTGSRIEDDTLSSALMKKGVQAYNTDAVFTPGAYSAPDWPVTWGAFTITFADGSTQAINAGSLNLTSAGQVKYLYWVEGVATLQVATTYSAVLGDDRALVAIVAAPPAADDPTSQRASVHVFSGLGESVHSGVISANAIVAAHLQADSVETAKITANAVTSAKITTGQIIAKDFRTAQNVGDAGGPTGIRFTANEIAGYLGGNPSTKRFSLEASTGKATAGGGAVVLDENGILVSGQYLTLESGAITRGWVWGANPRLLAVSASGQGLSLGAGGLVPLSPTNNIQMGVPTNQHIILAPVDTVRPVGTATWFGNAVDFWDQIHYRTLVSHTPALAPERDVRGIVRSIRRRADGKLNKQVLPEDCLVRPTRDQVYRSLKAKKLLARAEKLRAQGKTDDEIANARDTTHVGEREIESALADEETVGVKVDMLNMAAWEAVGGLLDQVDQLSARLAALETGRG